MTPADANDCARQLRGLFPSLSEEQVLQFAADFERYEYGDVTAGISDHYRETVDGFVKPFRLMESIRGYARKRTQMRPHPALEARKVDEQLEHVEEVIAGLSDSELAPLQERALSELHEVLRPRLVKKGARNSRTLKVAIVRILEGKPVDEMGASNA